MKSSAKVSILQEMHAREEGLTDEEVLQHRATCGYNEIPKKQKSAFKQFLKQFNNTMVFILLGATLVSLAAPLLRGEMIHSDEIVNVVAILSIVFLNAILGFVQEGKAERAIEMLSQLSAPQVRVRRNGAVAVIPARELVVGDTMLIEGGDKISADAIITESSSLMVDQSSLTGESVAEAKKVCTPEERSSGVGTVFAGTIVTLGSGEAIVSAIALNTEIGKVASLVMSTESPKTPLQKKLEAMSGKIGLLVVGICIAVFGIGIVKSINPMAMLFTAVSLAVAAVPEGLPAVVTICLAIGVQRMYRKNALVRRLDAIETLGSITIICADKTGTMTQNSMTVVEEWVRNDSERTLLAQIMASCNRAQEPNIGDPTEVALLRYAKEKMAERFRIESEPVPFTSEEKYMITTHEIDGHIVSFAKGAPEVIERLCSDTSQEISSQNERMAKQGMRVLAGAIDRGNGFECIGLMGMVDPPREGVKDAIARARNAGIRTIMITGDNPLTAANIAAEVGIETERVIVGKELDTMSTEELSQALSVVSVFARVLPIHKVTILETLQSMGHIVAMSGDGVNDAPALKRAHVGIAMGNKGTDIARESAAMVLVDDNYRTIVSAIEEGRRIYENIRTFVLFLLRTNIGEVLMIVGALLVNLPLPLLPLHILWVNLVTDSFPALALAAEKGKQGIMNRPPRLPTESILSGQLLLTVVAGLLNAGCVLIVFALLLQAHPENESLARSAALTVTVLFQCYMAFSTRVKTSVFLRSPLENPWLIFAVIGSLIVHVIMLESPLNRVLFTVSLPLYVWLWSVAAATIGCILFECVKSVSLFLTAKER